MSGISLADWLRAQDDAFLAGVLRARPDLATPPPSDTTVLATRAGTRASIARACDGLDRFTLSVLDALVVAGADHRPAAPAEVNRLLGAGVPAAATGAALDRLRAQALAWGPAGELTVPPSAREVSGAFPAGLGRSAPELAGVDLPAVLAGLGESERRLLGTLADGPPIGQTRDASAVVTAETARNPVQRLLAAGLLLRRDAETVELPREIAFALRGDRPLGMVQPHEPAVDRTARNPSTVDSTGAGEALEVLRHIETLLTLWSQDPPPVLRSGGLGVREQRRLARAVDADEKRAMLLAELAVGAGLVQDTESTSPEWVPTTAADGWLAVVPEQRWAALAAAWLDLPRLPGLAGLRDDKERLLAPLADELRRPLAPRDRRRTLAALAELPEGTAVADPDEVAGLLAWREPRRGGRLRDDLVRWTLAEATALGVVAFGAITGPGRALLHDGPVAAAKRMAVALPEPLDHVLVQADLTVVAPGPLEPELAEEIALVADVESAGGATVYRVGEESVRRALDAGRTAGDLHELFKTRSRTPVPQSLDYLIDDVARRHGRLRGGAAGSFLRCDDEVLVAEVLAGQVAAGLELRRIAPTVLISPLPLAEVLDALRDAGFAPAAEGPDGQVLDLRDRGRRMQARPRQERSVHQPPVLNDDQLATVVRQLRVGDSAAGARRGRVVTMGPNAGAGDTSATLAALAGAVRERRTVWVGYVDAQGVASRRFVEPVGVSAGILEGIDRGLGELRQFSLHRITSVVVSDDDPAGETANGSGQH